MGWPGAMSTIRCTRLVVEIGLSLYISREKGGHYYLQTLHNDIFSQYNLIMSPPGHPTILLKSDLFNMAAVSVKNSFDYEFLFLWLLINNLQDNHISLPSYLTNRACEFWLRKRHLI